MNRMCKMALAAVALVVAGCSIDTVDDTDVNEEKLWGDYQVVYDDGELDLRYYAQLRLGGSTGTTIRLSEGSLAIDGKSMRLVDGEDQVINVTGTFYRLEESTDAPPSTHTFTWTRSDGSAFDNTIETVAAFTVAEPAAGAALTGGDLAVRLDGPPLGGNEHYRVTVDAVNRAGEGQVSSLSETTQSGERVVFPADDVEKLPPGRLMIRARRVWAGAPQSGHEIEGGKLTSIRIAPDVEVNLTLPGT